MGYDGGVEMTEVDVVQLYGLLRDAGVGLWIDGGWGVDALLGRQTRRHSDLDVVIEARHEGLLQSALRGLGFADKPRDDTSPWNYVLADGAGREVDVHVVTLDERGIGLYGPAERGEMYPASALTGVGTIGGLTVKCIAAADIIKFHTGYSIDENDYHDVMALSARFGIEPPEEFRQFSKKDEEQK